MKSKLKNVKNNRGTVLYTVMSVLGILVIIATTLFYKVSNLTAVMKRSVASTKILSILESAADEALLKVLIEMNNNQVSFPIGETNEWYKLFRNKDGGESDSINALKYCPISIDFAKELEVDLISVYVTYDNKNLFKKKSKNEDFLSSIVDKKESFGSLVITVIAAFDGIKKKLTIAKDVKVVNIAPPTVDFSLYVENAGAGGLKYDETYMEDDKREFKSKFLYNMKNYDLMYHMNALDTYSSNFNRIPSEGGFLDYDIYLSILNGDFKNGKIFLGGGRVLEKYELDVTNYNYLFLYTDLLTTPLTDPNDYKRVPPIILNITNENSKTRIGTGMAEVKQWFTGIGKDNVQNLLSLDLSGLFGENKTITAPYQYSLDYEITTVMGGSGKELVSGDLEDSIWLKAKKKFFEMFPPTDDSNKYITNYMKFYQDKMSTLMSEYNPNFAYMKNFDMVLSGTKLFGYYGSELPSKTDVYGHVYMQVAEKRYISKFQGDEKKEGELIIPWKAENEMDTLDEKLGLIADASKYSTSMSNIHIKPYVGKLKPNYYTDILDENNVDYVPIDDNISNLDLINNQMQIEKLMKEKIKYSIADNKASFVFPSQMEFYTYIRERVFPNFIDIKSKSEVEKLKFADVLPYYLNGITFIQNMNIAGNNMKFPENFHYRGKGMIASVSSLNLVLNGVKNYDEDSFLTIVSAPDEFSEILLNLKGESAEQKNYFITGNFDIIVDERPVIASLLTLGGTLRFQQENINIMNGNFENNQDFYYEYGKHPVDTYFEKTLDLEYSNIIKKVGRKKFKIFGNLGVKFMDLITLYQKKDNKYFGGGVVKYDERFDKLKKDPTTGEYPDSNYVVTLSKTDTYWRVNNE